MSEETAVNIEKNTCPRCGFNLNKTYNRVDDALVKKYFAAALSQTPFQNTYQLFNGLLEITFEEASGELMAAQEKAMVALNGDNRISLSDTMDFAMIPSLVSVTLCSPESGTTTTLYSADVNKRKAQLEAHELAPELKKLPIVQLQSIRNAFADFAKLCGDLVTGAQDPSFWTGDGRN